MAGARGGAGRRRWVEREGETRDGAVGGMVLLCKAGHVCRHEAVRQLSEPLARSASHSALSCRRVLSPPAAGVELGANYPFPVISQEESVAALAAANAVVAQCQHGAGGGSGAQGVAASTGPFRPATAADPAEAERLFAENYRCEAWWNVGGFGRMGRAVPVHPATPSSLPGGAWGAAQICRRSQWRPPTKPGTYASTSLAACPALQELAAAG